MEYGVFTSKCFEAAVTELFTLCFYRNDDGSVIGSKLYCKIGDDAESVKQLVAICERSIPESRTSYAYWSQDDQDITNDADGVCRQLRSQVDFDLDKLKKVDSITLSEPYEMPSVSEKGIAGCLKMWRMGATLMMQESGMMFFMVTNKIEYVFSITPEDCNIYCGATVTVPCDNGLLSRGQYFRLRNYKDNSFPYCRFHCDLGKDIDDSAASEVQCENGCCTTTPQGLFWPVKRYNDNEIVLDGCGGDEYVHYRYGMKDEYFV